MSDLKGLNVFNRFDIAAFLAKKTLLCTGTTDWRDFASGKLLGTKVETVIIADDTDYRRPDGKPVSNRFEKLVIKVPKTIEVPQDSIVRPVNPTASVYGDYRNQLSAKAEGIEVVPQRQGQH